MGQVGGCCEWMDGWVGRSAGGGTDEGVGFADG